MTCLKFNLFITRGSSLFMYSTNEPIFQTQLILTTECKRERFSYFFRVRAERKKSSGLKGLIIF